MGKSITCTARIRMIMSRGIRWVGKVARMEAEAYMWDFSSESQKEREQWEDL
jgi:hypothetical protein